ncbi:GNAT family N-acetyltransferase [Saccharopolyspora gloriosae]|uniref:GNAT superfamily N-acetyltransferase n=1 Tax=Saccharopolyspora gloriosae TaxID=455344 RepID=A0A840NMI3_9PSEU|nr:GNAT family N-acetyltransferase [Saccharopolyspora gloriosae]MBB5070312.1 GNAT superfamily N-acetyltransferase [Saccharopolyspora gloriosae]
MDEHASLLAAYDEHLRADAEAVGALGSARRGPLLLLTFSGGRGLVTYRDLGGADAVGVRRLVEEAVAHYRTDPAITEVEWKTRGHDHAPGLHDALLDNGFVPDAPESIMIGATRSLAVDVELPAGVRVRRVTEESDVRAMTEMQHEVFGVPISDEQVDAVHRRLALDDGIQLWAAESAGLIVCAGRLEPVRGTDFAGIWGGATRPEWRGRGIYRALTAARARAALELGKTLINSDSTEFSRPILERSGLREVSTTTPYRHRT